MEFSESVFFNWNASKISGNSHADATPVEGRSGGIVAVFRGFGFDFCEFCEIICAENLELLLVVLKWYFGSLDHKTGHRGVIVNCFRLKRT